LKIGITGARGLIGTALTTLLTTRGHEVVAFTRNPESALPGAGEVRQFLPDKSAETDVSGLDALVHLAGESVLGYWTAGKKAKIHSSRVAGTEGLVTAMKQCENPPQVFVSASGTGYYGNRGDEVLTEESDFGSGFLVEVTKAWESAAMQAEKLGIRVVRARIGMVLGKGGGAAPLLRRLFRLCLGGRLGSGKHWMPWVHIDDMARMLLYAIEEEGLTGAVNCCAPEPVRNSDFTRVIARELRRPAIAWAPAPILKLLVGGMSEILLFSERVDPVVLKKNGFNWQYDELQAAIKDVMAD